MIGRNVRYLQNGVKELFQSEEIVEYCTVTVTENNVVLQLLVAYNYTMQACVEGALDCIKQRTQTSLLHAGKPTHFWKNATKDFRIKEGIPLGITWRPRPQAWETLQQHAAGFLRLSSALTKLSMYLLNVKSSLSCLVSTAWSRMDYCVIDLLKAPSWRTSIVSKPHFVSKCSASPSNARSKCKISSHLLFNSFSKTCHVLRATSQECWKKSLECTRMTHMTTIWSLNHQSPHSRSCTAAGSWKRC